MVTPSEQARLDTEQAVDETAFNETVRGLRANYLKLQAAAPNDLKPIQSFLDDNKNIKANEFNAYIDMTAREILADNSDRATNLRRIIQEKKPEIHARLGNFGKIREAAAAAAENNTGDIGFLGGSTVTNAIGGFFKWLFDGEGGVGGFFQKIGELLNWMFTGEAPAGLINTIKESGVANTVNDFKANMASQGIDPAIAAEAANDFEYKARKKVGLRVDERPAEKPPHETPVTGYDPAEERRKAQEAQAQAEARREAVRHLNPKNLNNTEAVKGLLETHFAAVGKNVHKELTNLMEGVLPEDQKAQSEALLTQAEATLTRKGTEMVQNAVGKGALPSDFTIIQETFREVQSKLDPKDTASIAVMKNVMAEFDKPGATFTTVTEGLKKYDEATKNMIYVVTKAAKTMGNNRQALNEIFIAAQPPSADPGLVDKARAAASADAARAEAEAKLQARKSAKGEVAVALDKALTPTKVKGVLDEAVRKKVYDNWFARGAANNWAAVSYVGSLGFYSQDYAPDPGERSTMAMFISTNMKEIVKSEMDKQIDSGNPINVNDVIKNTMKEFDTRYNAAIKDGTLTRVWAPQKETIKAQMEEKLRENLDAKKVGSLNQLLGFTDPSAATRKVSSGVDVSNRPFTDLPTPLPGGSPSAPGDTGAARTRGSTRAAPVRPGPQPVPPGQ